TASTVASSGCVDAAVQCVDPVGLTDWDASLAGQPQTSIFHGAAWAAVLKGTYGYKPKYFTIRQDGGLRSLLPLMEVDSWLSGRRGISLPFTDECEPLSADQ